MYDIGDLITLSASFSASSGTLTDPTTLQLAVRGPGGSVLHVYPTSTSLVKASTGLYYLYYPAASAGEYYYTWSASGAVEGAQEGAFTVARAGSPVLTAYAETTDVAALCQNLLLNAADFSATTMPPITAVITWLNRGAALINNRLRARGFEPPTDYTSPVWFELADLNTFYAVARAEKSRQNVLNAPPEQSRAQAFQKQFDDGLKDLLSSDLSRAGLTYTTLGYVGGVSNADKTAVQNNGDRVPMRFSRNQFKNPRSPEHHENDQTDDIEVRQ